MQRALILLNPYVREGGRRKLKNGLKTQKMHFLPVFASSPWKLVTNCVRMDGTQILWLWWFTAKNHSPQTFQPAVYLFDLGFFYAE